MKVYPFASFLIACAHTSGQSGCPLHAYVLKPHPLLTIFYLSFLTLGDTGPGVHDEGRPPESRDGGEERSLPATNHVCITARKEVTIMKPCFVFETACIIYLHGNEEGLYSGMNLILAPILHQWKGQHPYRIKEQH